MSLAERYPWASPDAVNRLTWPQMLMYLKGRVKPKPRGFPLRGDDEIMALARGRTAGVKIESRAELTAYMKAEADGKTG